MNWLCHTVSGEELWKVQPQQRGQLAIEEEPSLSAPSAVALSDQTALPKPAEDHTFFRIAETALTSSTFLGDTTMTDVDFFAQVYQTLDIPVSDTTHGVSVHIALKQKTFVATRRVCKTCFFAESEPASVKHANWGGSNINVE